MLKFVGDNAHLDNIPARDLNDEEVKKYGKKRLLESGLYKEVKTESIEKDEVKHGHQSVTQDSAWS